jgi:hypothetical protein
LPYARTFVKVRINGHFGPSSTPPGGEQWSTGFNISSVGGGSFDPVNLLAFLTAIDPLVATFHGSTTTAASTTCYYDQLTAAYIGTDGKYVLGSLQPTTVFNRATPIAGVGTGNGPWSQACVLTLRSLRLRGPASHGRMYWPAPAMVVTPNTGLITSATVTGVVGNARTMLNAINVQAAAKFGTGSNVALVSQVGGGVESTVTSVGVGSRLDSMESRERNLLEAHSFLALTTTLLLEEERNKQLREGYEDLDGAPDSIR